MDNQNKTQGIPTFTPPENNAPVFTPPKTPQHNGPVCYHHPTEPAVARCARCGKYICKDCAEAYGVTGGEYAGKHLCYDCCEQLVADNIAELTANKETIAKHYKVTRIGATIGAVFGFVGGIAALFSGEARFFEGLLATVIYVLIFGLIGGSFLSFVKLYVSMLGESVKIAFQGILAGIGGNFGEFIGGLIGLCIAFSIGILKCMWYTISKLWKYSKYLKETEGFIESDSAALQQIRDYMQYTLVRNQNKGVDLEDLMNEGSGLYNNSYAQAVRDNGEAAADAALRQATTRIAENGEIIRDFPGAAAA